MRRRKIEETFVQNGFFQRESRQMMILQTIYNQNSTLVVLYDYIFLTRRNTCYVTLKVLSRKREIERPAAFPTKKLAN